MLEDDNERDIWVAVSDLYEILNAGRQSYDDAVAIEAVISMLEDVLDRCAVATKGLTQS